MIRYLRMDLKRLVKTRGFYITILLALGLIALFATASWFFADNMIRHSGSMGIGGIQGVTLIETARRAFNVARFASFFMSPFSLLHLLLAVFAASFISKDHHSGYLKNLFVLRDLREKWLVGKLVTLMVGAVVYYLCIILGSVVATLLFGNQPVINLAQLGAFFGLHLTVDMALFALICLVTAFFQSRTAAVVLGMLLAFNIQNIIYLLVDQMGVLPFKLVSHGMMTLASRLDVFSFGGAQPDILSMGMGAMGGGAAVSATAGQLLPISLSVFAVAVLLSWVTLRHRDYRG